MATPLRWESGATTNVGPRPVSYSGQLGMDALMRMGCEYTPQRRAFESGFFRLLSLLTLSVHYKMLISLHLPLVSEPLPFPLSEIFP